MTAVSQQGKEREALYRQARDCMAQLLPGWSDQIPSDPAVAVLELAACLSAAQNRRLEQVREEHWLAYLKLLGERPAQLTPARLLARPASRAGLCEGMRFYIDGVPFEAADGWQHGDNGIESIVLIQGERRTELTAGAPLRLTAGRDIHLRVTFRRPLAAGVPARLWFSLLPEPGRIPPDEDTPPPVILLAQADSDGAQAAADCRDGTCGLLRSGFVTVTPRRMADALLISVQGEIEGTPQISAVVWEPVLLEQRRTRSRCLELPPPFRLPPGYDGSWALRFFLPCGDGWREDPGLSVRDGCVTGWGRCPEKLRRYRSHTDLAQCGRFEGGGYRSRWYRGLAPGMEWLRLSLDGAQGACVRVYACDEPPRQWEEHLIPSLERTAADLLLYGVRGLYLCFTVEPAQDLRGYELAFPGLSIDSLLPAVLQGDDTLRKLLGVYQSLYMDLNRELALFPGRLDPQGAGPLLQLPLWLGADGWVPEGAYNGGRLPGNDPPPGRNTPGRFGPAGVHTG